MLSRASKRGKRGMRMWLTAQVISFLIGISVWSCSESQSRLGNTAHKIGHVKRKIESPGFRRYACDRTRERVQAQTLRQISRQQRPIIGFLSSCGLERCLIGFPIDPRLESCSSIPKRREDLD